VSSLRPLQKKPDEKLLRDDCPDEPEGSLQSIDFREPGLLAQTS
jgi:hypothetical protein